MWNNSLLWVLGHYFTHFGALGTHNRLNGQNPTTVTCVLNGLYGTVVLRGAGDLLLGVGVG